MAQSDNDNMIEFDLNTLEPIVPNHNNDNIDHNDDNVDEIPVPDGCDSPSLNESDGFNSDSYSSDNDYYEIFSTDTEDEDTTYPIDNFQMSIYDNNHPHVLVIDIEDQLNKWSHPICDPGPLYGPFLSSSYINIKDTDQNPEFFFNSLFDEQMWTIISDAR